jgi:hypothetical protein
LNPDSDSHGRSPAVKVITDPAAMRPSPLAGAAITNSRSPPRGFLKVSQWDGGEVWENVA